MQPTRVFWLSTEKPVNDTFKIGDQELYLDTTYEPEWHVNQEAYVHEVPLIPEFPKHKIEKGEKAIVHHNIPTFDQRQVTYADGKNIFWAHQTEIFCTISEDGEIKMQEPWILVKPKNKPKSSSVIITLDEEGEWERHGELVHLNDSSYEMGMKEGDHIYYSKNSDYRIEVEGETYFRMRNDDVELIFDE